jgi:polyisoprenoid-binding protein YceI
MVPLVATRYMISADARPGRAMMVWIRVASFIGASLLSATMLVVASSALAEETYVIDPVHSQPMFEVRHMGFSMQRGTFTKATGKITLDVAAKQGSVDVTIDTNSIRTMDPRLDAHVKAEDFFNVATYPTMTFKSSRVVFDGGAIVAVDGDLTLLGISKPVTLKVSGFVCGQNPLNKKSMCGAEATTNIKRSEWGMSYGIPKAVSDDVQITIPIEAYKE